MFRRKRLLIIGCGDVGQRIAALACKHWRVFGVARSAGTADRIRSTGAVPLRADAPDRRLQDLADWVVHSAPPPADARRADGRCFDPLTRAWTAKLLRLPADAMPGGVASRVKRLVYLSTTGVYGDRQGHAISEATVVRPTTERARRRVDAEQWLRLIGRRSRRLRLTVLRAPGIYAIDRLPIKRLQQGLPALLPQDDVQTNHIHADDLARMTRMALFRHHPQRTFNIVDDSRLLMGDYLDMVARWAGLPLPPRVDRQTLLATVTPMRASFMSESRQVSNLRMKRELRLALRYPTVADFLASRGPRDGSAGPPI